MKMSYYLSAKMRKWRIDKVKVAKLAVKNIFVSKCLCGAKIKA